MTLRLDPGCFYGKMLKNVRGSRFMLSESVYRPGSSLPRHSHLYPYFCIVLKGRFIENCSNKTSERTPSTAIFHPVGEDHSERFGEQGARLFCFEIEPAWLEQLRECEVRLSRPATYNGGSLLWLFARLYAEFRNIDSVSPLAMEGLALEVFAQASRGCQAGPAIKPPQWLKQVHEMLHDRFNEQLAMDELARSAGVHPGHLARTFRQFYRCTVGDYLRKLRVEFASRQLVESDSSLACVGASAGFSDQPHFSRTFKSLTGMTPAEYRGSFRRR
ncbi:MAG TPA: AraC family transcriptional regulator [Blastocatellia bacterium]|nr:AraC family transcriptional regulator [Blastocatellia bacterium]